MDFYAEEEKRKQKALAEIAQLVDEHYQLSHQVESCQKRIAEIDKLVAEREARLLEIDQAQRNFNTYLAIKEGVVTLDQIEQAVKSGEPLKVSKDAVVEVEPKK